MRIIIIFLTLSVQLSAQDSIIAPTSDKKEKHVFYLHGSILEGASGNMISPEFGEYQYDKIIKRFAESGIIVHSELREAETSIDIYADKIILQLETLLADGVNAEDITIVGASKGGLIAMMVSTKFTDPAISYIILGSCNQWVADHYAFSLHGRIFSIFEHTDEMGGESCDVMKANSPDMYSFIEMKTNTGLGHGFLYKPLDEWMDISIMIIKMENE